MTKEVSKTYFGEKWWEKLILAAIWLAIIGGIAKFVLFPLWPLDQRFDLLICVVVISGGASVATYAIAFLILMALGIQIIRDKVLRRA